MFHFETYSGGGESDAVDNRVKLFLDRNSTRTARVVLRTLSERAYGVEHSDARLIRLKHFLAVEIEFH